MADKQAKIIGYAIMNLVGTSFISLARIQPDGSFSTFLDDAVGVLLFCSSVGQFHKLSK